MVLSNLVPWQHASSAGFVLRGYHSKPSGKPWLHFIHGNGFCGLTYEHMLVHFQDDFDLFISDAQGHGESDAGQRFLGWGKTADLALEVIRSKRKVLGDRPIVLMGHSFGGAVSTLMLARDHDLFTGGVFLDPIYLPNPTLGFAWVLAKLKLTQYLMPLARQAKVRQIEWPDRDNLWNYFYQRGVFKGVDDRCLESYLEHALNNLPDGRFTLKCPPRIESGIFANAAFSLWQELPDIKQPAHVVIGDRSFDFLNKVGPTLVQRNHRFSHSFVEGGHCFMLENPLETAEYVLPKTKSLLESVR